MAAPNRAAVALSKMRERLGITRESSEVALTQRAAISESVKDRWVREGLVVQSSALSETWHCSSKALEGLPSFAFRGGCWYPSPMTRVSPSNAHLISSALGTKEWVVHVIFWNMKHGSLGGITTADAVAGGLLGDVLKIAEVAVVQSVGRPTS